MPVSDIWEYRAESSTIHLSISQFICQNDFFGRSRRMNTSRVGLYIFSYLSLGLKGFIRTRLHRLKSIKGASLLLLLGKPLSIIYPFKRSVSLSSYSSPFQLDYMIGNNNLIDDSDRPTPAAADRLGKTMNSGSPQMQKSDIQEVNGDEDIRQTHKQYHFQNCGAVYIDSLNARGVRMENCGNHVPQFTCS